MADFYLSGGFWMHLITLAGLASAGLAALQLARWRKASYAGAIVGAVTLTQMLGVLGTTAGLIEMFAALNAIEPAMRTTLLHQGLAITFNPLGWSLLCGLPTVVIATVAAGLRAHQGDPQSLAAR